MRYIAKINANGAFVTIFTSVEVYPEETLLANGDKLLNLESTLTPTELIEHYYWDDAALTVAFRGAKPNKYSNWNIITKVWEDTPEGLTAAALEVKKTITNKQKELAIAPIEYNTILFDADEQAQSNISGKLQEIFARETANIDLISGEMFWKDANNVMYSWADQTAYKLWLQGLVIAISSRNTGLYAASWNKKAEVEGLSTINDILSYDVTANWI